ncbi:MAG: carbohydrate ABC transporter permease [Chelatococcus sp.]|jgi:putative chitobiose transport system permease protein|uniref:carbohydrate ABC transporter permease n=1 Tax=unclassified Chelatococcus TaxID=2638111 RepID=UPI001BCDBBBA|nr:MULTISPECIES: carbohydrate ABC transporter permease [unclassified Chelatococcus]CAH1651222.1 Carbohydrate ABC transporter membrane protein 2 (CUT1 family) [Hyphomicrobiales bacterium]MBS7743202.1 carbohydrate ABC transporter permease [Chelatococcus sp. HY11]MBX3538276.1 carbohydrate ABC transporter permease [Chelatococcus sp.]MBX3541680.1 carbohydrate ABC transporter permease [Chelatococcus sp.]MCO5074428.1 carbohydrate ABC transporter permease [Chelatococcus sp.]
MKANGPWLRFAFVVACCVVVMLPLWWAAASALRPSEEVFRYLSPISVWTLIPREWTLSNFAALSQGPFAQAMINSALVTTLTVVIGLVVCSTAAFALAVLEYPGRGVIFAIMVVSFLIPFDSIAVPLSELFRGLQLQNSYAGLILPGIGNGLAVFMLRQFFMAIPKELSEAAKIDGLGWGGIFLRIYLPLSRPALIGAGLILFVFQWQAYLWPLLIAPNPDYHVASVAIASFAGQYDVDYGQMFGGAVVTALLPMAILLVFQRYFIASMASSGSKE